MDVRFRRLTDEDLPLLHQWLNDPAVVRWWEGDDVSFEAVTRDYGSASTEPTEYYIASIDGTDVGWIQCYATASYPGEEEVQQWAALDVDPTAGGIDYLIGEVANRRKGMGTAMIRAFVEQVVWPEHPGWTQVCASPVAANVASCRALERAGFTYVGSFDSEFGSCRLFCLPRPDTTE